MAIDLKKADLRYTNNFALRLVMQVLYELLWRNDVNARSHQRLNGRGAGLDQ